MTYDKLIKKSIQNIYFIFMDYHANIDMNFCSHCFDKEYIQIITSKDLKLLTGKELLPFATDAIHLIGNLKDFKYFLPRILELIVMRDKEFAVDPEIIFSKFSYHSTSDWLYQEMFALKEFISIFWKNQINHYKNFNNESIDIDSILCSIGQCEFDINWYLKNLEESDEYIFYSYFFDILYINLDSIINYNRLSNPFWKNNLKNMDIYISWIINNIKKLEVKSLLYVIPETESYRKEFVLKYYNLVKNR